MPEMVPTYTGLPLPSAFCRQTVAVVLVLPLFVQYK